MTSMAEGYKDSRAAYRLSYSVLLFTKINMFTIKISNVYCSYFWY